MSKMKDKKKFNSVHTDEGKQMYEQQDDNDTPHGVIAITNFSQLKYHKEKHRIHKLDLPQYHTNTNLWLDSWLERYRTSVVKKKNFKNCTHPSDWIY